MYSFGGLSENVTDSGHYVRAFPDGKSFPKSLEIVDCHLVTIVGPAAEVSKELQEAGVIILQVRVDLHRLIEFGDERAQMPVSGVVLE